jgi:hypothetical protein
LKTGSTMTRSVPLTVDDLIGEAAALPLQDAAYAIWRQKAMFERLELRSWPPRDYSTPEAAERSAQENRAERQYEHDFAQDGPSFDRLRRAHPDAADADLKQAIITAVKFDDDCFKYFSYGRAEDYWEMCIRAVARAAQQSPGYLETTMRDARNHVAYYMK